MESPCWKIILNLFLVFSRMSYLSKPYTLRHWIIWSQGMMRNSLQSAAIPFGHHCSRKPLQSWWDAMRRWTRISTTKATPQARDKSGVVWLAVGQDWSGSLKHVNLNVEVSRFGFMVLRFISLSFRLEDMWFWSPDWKFFWVSSRSNWRSKPKAILPSGSA